MERENFIEILAREGFDEMATVCRQADGFLAMHAHSFEAKGLILRGELRICTGGVEQVYQADDVFHLRADEPHSEHYGAEGVEYLVGRK